MELIVPLEMTECWARRFMSRAPFSPARLHSRSSSTATSSSGCGSDPTPSVSRPMPQPSHPDAPAHSVSRPLCLTRVRCGVQCQQVKAGIVPHPQQHGAQGLPVQPNWAAHIAELPDGVPKVRAAVRHTTYHVPRCAGPDGVWVCVQLGHGPPAPAAPRSGSAMADMQGQMQQMMMQLQMQSCMQQLQSPRVQTPGMAAAAAPQAAAGGAAMAGAGGAGTATPQSKTHWRFRCLCSRFLC